MNATAAAPAIQPEKSSLFKKIGASSETRRESREEKESRLAKGKAERERLGMARKDIPTVLEMEQAMESATTEARLQVHQGFVTKALEDVFEDYPNDFDLEKCKKMPTDKRGGLNLRRSFGGGIRGAIEREGRRGETSIFADVIKGEDGKEYAQLWIDTGAHWDPRVNPCAVVICELDDEKKPILNSGPNEGKAVIKVMTEQDLNQAAKTKAETPPKEEVTKYKIGKPKFWKLAVGGLAGMFLIPDRVKVKKKPEKLQAEMDRYALARLVQGKITPEEFNKVTDAKKKGEKWNEENASGLRNKVRSEKRIQELGERREFLKIQQETLESDHSAERDAAIAEATPGVEEEEEKTELNATHFENALRGLLELGKLDDKMFKNLLEVYGASGLTPAEAAEIRQRVERNLGTATTTDTTVVSGADTEATDTAATEPDDTEKEGSEETFDAMDWFEKTLALLLKDLEDGKSKGAALHKRKAAARATFKANRDMFVELGIDSGNEMVRQIESLLEGELEILERDNAA